MPVQPISSFCSRFAALACCITLAVPLAAPLAAAQSASASTNANLSNADQGVLQDLARANLAEIDLGRLALAKTQNTQVKNYAQRMVDDHQKSLQDVTQFAQAHNVTLPNEADMKHRDLHKQLDAMTGERFDQQYMARNGAAEHRVMHGHLLQAQRSVSDPDLKALVMRMEPLVEQHMQMAREVDLKGSSAGSTGTSGTSGYNSGPGGRTPR